MFWGVCEVSGSGWKLGVVTGWAPFTEIIGRISVSQIRLDLVHMGTHGPAPASTALHSSRDGGSCSHSSGWAGLVLQQLNKHAHLWAQPRHHAGPNAVHRVLITVHQALEQLTIKPRTTRHSITQCLFRGAQRHKKTQNVLIEATMFSTLCPLTFQILVQNVCVHVRYGLMSSIWGVTVRSLQNLCSPPSHSFCIHSQTAILHVLGQQKERKKTRKLDIPVWVSFAVGQNVWNRWKPKHANRYKFSHGAQIMAGRNFNKHQEWWIVMLKINRTNKLMKSPFFQNVPCHHSPRKTSQALKTTLFTMLQNALLIIICSTQHFCTGQWDPPIGEVAG